MRHPYQIIEIHPETGRVHVATVNDQPTMAQQQYKDECDVNKIMEKYQKTGEFTHSTEKKGTYGDFSEITDYHTMVNTVTYAQEAFMLLPANVRIKFRNDPGELLKFIQDDKNYDEALKLGLLNQKPIQTPPENTQTNKTNAKQPAKPKLPPIPESQTTES